MLGLRFISQELVGLGWIPRLVFLRVKAISHWHARLLLNLPHQLLVRLKKLNVASVIIMS